MGFQFVLGENRDCDFPHLGMSITLDQSIVEVLVLAEDAVPILLDLRLFRRELRMGFAALMYQSMLSSISFH